MRYNGKYNTGKKPPVFRLLLLALLVSALALGAFTLAKYTLSRQNDTQAQAYSFYFESDLLRAGDAPCQFFQYKLRFPTAPFGCRLLTPTGKGQVTGNLSKKHF